MSHQPNLSQVDRGLVVNDEISRRNPPSNNVTYTINESTNSTSVASNSTSDMEVAHANVGLGSPQQKEISQPQSTVMKTGETHVTLEASRQAAGGNGESSFTVRDSTIKLNSEGDVKPSGQNSLVTRKRSENQDSLTNISRNIEFQYKLNDSIQSNAAPGANLDLDSTCKYQEISSSPYTRTISKADASFYESHAAIPYSTTGAAKKFVEPTTIAGKRSSANEEVSTISTDENLRKQGIANLHKSPKIIRNTFNACNNGIATIAPAATSAMWMGFMYYAVRKGKNVDNCLFFNEHDFNIQIKDTPGTQYLVTNNLNEAVAYILSENNDNWPKK